MLGVLIFAFLASCTKENSQDNPQNGGGTYNPEKKIQKIYMTDKYHEEKELIETWHWNGNKLESIDYYNFNKQIYGVEKFTYDGNCVTRIDYYRNENLEEYSLFNYENNVLASIDNYYYSNFDQEIIKDYTITLGYQDDKLSQVVENYANSSNPRIWQLTWDGDNITRIKSGNDENHGLWYEYDNNNNPMNGRLFFDFVVCLTGNTDKWDPVSYYGPFFSRNNCTKIIENLHKDGTYYVSYLYDEDGYPTKQMKGTTTFYYEYE